MATTAENLAAINAAIDADPGLNSGFRARAKRDDTVLKVLEQIKTKVGTDKEQYITSALAEAKAYVEANKEALIKLKELRAQSPVDDAAVSALFAANNGEGKDLVTARAYLIVGAGLAEARPDDPNAKIFAEILDKDATTQKFTDANIDEKLIYSITDAAKNTSSTVDDLHKACTDAASAEILAIRSYLDDAKKRKEEAAKQPGTNPTKGDGGSNGSDPSTGNGGGAGTTSAPKLVKSKFTLGADGVVSDMAADSRFAQYFGNGDTLIGLWEVAEKYSSGKTINAEVNSATFLGDAIKVLESSFHGNQIGVRIKRTNGDINTIFIDGIIFQPEKAGPPAPPVNNNPGLTLDPTLPRDPANAFLDSLDPTRRTPLP